MKKSNGWKRIALIAGAIAAIVVAVTAMDTYAPSHAPWAPRHTFALAAENTIDRWTETLIKLKFLVEQTKNSGDRLSQASWEKQLLEVQRKINELLVEKAERK